MAIGGRYEGERSYEDITINLEKGDCIYSFTDGYQDQFGGPKEKKLMKKRMLELLIDINTDPMSVQEQKIKEYLSSWQGAQEQVDDIQMIGIRF